MAADVTDVHIQDLASVFESAFSPAEFADALRRFGAEETAAEAAEGRVADGLRAVAESGPFREILAYLLSEGTFDESQREAITAALEGSPLSVRGGSDGLELYQQITGVADRSVQTAREYLEANAPEMIEIQLQGVESNLAEGEYDLAAADMTRAFDSLVVSGYTDGLEELIETGVIHAGGDFEYNDANVLYVIYGYCSMLGGDPEAKGFETSRLQAELATVMAQESLYFLLRTLEEAADEGVELDHWTYP